MSRLSDMSGLLEETLDAYYWAGFLAADGSFERRGRLRFCLSDHDQVRRFASFIGWRGSFSEHNGALGIHVMDAKRVGQFCRKFGFVPDKTVNPPEDIPSGDSDLRFAYAVGVVDGDGCIQRKSGGRPDAFLRVKCHMSWFCFLGVVMRALTGQEVTGCDSGGYAEYGIYEHALLKEIKRRVLSLELPVLRRKWDAIDTCFVSRSERSKERISQARVMLSAGKAKIDVAESLGMSKSAVANMIRRHNIPAYVGRMKGR